MISYNPFWKTLKEKKISTYNLIYKKGISNGTLYRMRRGEAITTTTLNDLCNALKCNVSEIIEYIPDEINNEIIVNENEISEKLTNEISQDSEK